MRTRKYKKKAKHNFPASELKFINYILKKKDMTPLCDDYNEMMKQEIKKRQKEFLKKNSNTSEWSAQDLTYFLTGINDEILVENIDNDQYVSLKQQNLVKKLKNFIDAVKELKKDFEEDNLSIKFNITKKIEDDS